MKMRNLIALCAAAAMMTGMTANVYADTLETRDGLKYRISDNGEDMGLYSGWTSRDGKRYYYKDGEMKRNCWLTSGGEKEYYLTGSGEAATGKLTVDGVEYEFDERGRVVPDEWGLSYTFVSFDTKGGTMQFTQSGGSPAGELQTTNFFVLERYEDGDWTVLEVIEESKKYNEFSWVDPIVIAEDDTTEIGNKWGWLYGPLAPGKYRMCRDVRDYRSESDHDVKTYYAYFEIE